MYFFEYIFSKCIFSKSKFSKCIFSRSKFAKCISPNMFYQKKCFLACNTNAWSTTEIIKDLKIKVWDEYLTKGSIVNDENYGYLIMDMAPSHDNEEILKLFSGGNREITLIPGGLTKYYQPLDVSVNMPFKNALREKYISYI